jgi:arginase
MRRSSLDLIAAPSNLGLRPPEPGQEPGTWQAPEALLLAGLASRVGSGRLVELARPPYDPDIQPATRIRNGVTIREHALTIADAVDGVLAASRFPLVLGGDCSILLGCLVGARRGGRCGLMHVDGHSDFFHPGNYDSASRLGAAAGMDLALATGRGELLLTHWPQVGIPLVADDDVVQIGDREAEAPSPMSSGDAVFKPPVVQFTVQEILRVGIADVSRQAVEHLERRGLDRVWLHVDLDVLDERVMPAVDSPGSPGLDFAQLEELMSEIVDRGRIVGLDLTIYDPARDPLGDYPPAIVDLLGSSLAAVAGARR